MTTSKDLEVPTIAWANAKATSESSSHIMQGVQSHPAMRMHTQLHTPSCVAASRRMLTGKLLCRYGEGGSVTPYLQDPAAALLACCGLQSQE